MNKINSIGVLEVNLTKLFGPSEIELLDRYIETFNKWVSKVNETKKFDMKLIAPGDYESILYNFVYDRICDLDNEIRSLDSLMKLNEVIA